MHDLSNEYFTFSNNMKVSDLSNEYVNDDLKVRVVSSWGKAEHLGTNNLSKALKPTDYGATKESPGACLLALRAWMICKARKNNFCNRKSCRRRLFGMLLKGLRDDIANAPPVGNRTTGNARADALIRQWAPEALVPE